MPPAAGPGFPFSMAAGPGRKENDQIQCFGVSFLPWPHLSLRLYTHGAGPPPRAYDTAVPCATNLILSDYELSPRQRDRAVSEIDGVSDFPPRAKLLPWNRLSKVGLLD